MYRVPQLVWGDAHAVQKGHSQLTRAQVRYLYHARCCDRNEILAQLTGLRSDRLGEHEIVDLMPGADHSAGEFRRGTDRCTGLGVDPSCTSSCEIDPRPWEARHFTATPSHRDAAMAEAVGIGLYGVVCSHVRYARSVRASPPGSNRSRCCCSWCSRQAADGSGGRREHLWLRFSHVPRLACAALHGRRWRLDFCDLRRLRHPSEESRRPPRCRLQKHLRLPPPT